MRADPTGHWQMSAMLHMSLTFFPLKGTEMSFCAYPALKIFVCDSNIFKQQHVNTGAVRKSSLISETGTVKWEVSSRSRSSSLAVWNYKWVLKMGLTLEPQEEEDLNKPGWAKERSCWFSSILSVLNMKFQDQRESSINSLSKHWICTYLRSAQGA